MRLGVSLLALCIGVVTILVAQGQLGISEIWKTPHLAMVGTQPTRGNPPPISDSDRAWSALKQLADNVFNDALGSATEGHASWRSLCEVTELCPDGVTLPSNSKVLLLAHNAFSAQPPTGSDANSVLFSSVFYNPTAEPFISACVDKQCADGISLPKGSLIGRFSWLRIQPDTCTKINVFQASDARDYLLTGKIILDSHPHNANTQVQPCRSVPGIPIYPLSKFLYVRRSEVSPGAFNTRFGPQLRASDEIAVVVGFNLMEKVNLSPASGKLDWVWSTFWWSLEPDTGGRAGLPCKNPSPCPTPHITPADIQAGHPMEWTNYVMNFVSTSMKPTDAFAAVSNPYLDGNAGIKSNCIVCHSYAMTPMNDDAGVPFGHLCGAQSAQSIKVSRLDSLITDYQINQTTGCPVSKRVKTDMVWTVAEFNTNRCGNRNCSGGK